MRRAIRPGGLWAAVVLALTMGSAHWQAAQAAPAADPIIHTVQPGETLYLIGLQYGVGWTDIMQANQLSNSIIYAGQQLIILAVGAAATSVSPDQAATPAPPALPDNPTTYVVQRGDNLA